MLATWESPEQRIVASLQSHANKECLSELKLLLEMCNAAMLIRMNSTRDNVSESELFKLNFFVYGFCNNLPKWVNRCKHLESVLEIVSTNANLHWKYIYDPLYEIYISGPKKKLTTTETEMAVVELESDLDEIPATA
jgi:predicted membrane protein